MVLALVAAAPGAWHILDAANECSRNCLVGIDVMQYGLKQEALDNQTSSCIGCGICVTVCPMDTLSVGGKGEEA